MADLGPPRSYHAPQECFLAFQICRASSEALGADFCHEDSDSYYPLIAKIEKNCRAEQSANALTT